MLGKRNRGFHNKGFSFSTEANQLRRSEFAAIAPKPGGDKLVALGATIPHRGTSQTKADTSRRDILKDAGGLLPGTRMGIKEGNLQGKTAIQKKAAYLA